MHDVAWPMISNETLCFDVLPTFIASLLHTKNVHTQPTLLKKNIHIYVLYRPIT